MRNIYLTQFLLLFALAVSAQQQAIFSQFFYQKTLMNPAASGSGGHATLAAFHRQQWAGLEGAPLTQALIFHAPVFHERVGVGVSLVNDRIGLFNSTFLNASYAYRVKLEEGVFSIGVQGSYLHHRADWGEAKTITPLTAQTTPGDEFVPVFNAGAGIYFEKEHFFAGASVPHLLEKGFLERYEGLVDDFSGTVRHLFIHAGWLIPVSEAVKLRPALATRIVKHAPPSTDVHLSVGLLEETRLWLGTTYRWSQSAVASPGDMLSVMCQYRLSERLSAGIAYDVSLNSLQQQTSGTWEMMLEYGFVRKEVEVHNPRYFY